MRQIGLEKNKREFHSTKYYVNAVKKETVRTDHPQQRESGQWPPEYRDGLIGTVLKNEDIPYIVICEQVTERGVDNYLIDGIQRVTTIFNYRQGVFKLGNKLENPLIEYQVNRLDEKGKPMRDKSGNLLHDTIVCDIRGKGYKDLPEELQELFDEFQLMEVKHLNCTDDQIGYHLRRYNHAKKMGASQNGITYLDKNIAMRVKKITSTHTFFKDLGNFKPAERNNDTLNRVVLESFMATYFMDRWKSPLKDICFFLNANLQEEMIAVFNKELDSISEVMKETVAEMFTSKNSFLWFVTYHKFCKTGMPSERFIDFMEAFKTHLHGKEWHGKTFDDMNKVSTKKKSCIIEKLQLLEDFMQEFLSTLDEEEGKVGLLDFIKENVKKEAVQEDLELYQDMLDDLILEVNNDTKLLNIENRASLTALVAYACEQDIDVDEWFIQYFKTHASYRKDQKSNFRCMADDLQKFMKKGERNGRKSMAEYI